MSEKKPLVKFDSGLDELKPKLFLGVGIVVSIVLYFSGVAFTNSILSFIGMLLVVVVGVSYFVYQRHAKTPDEVHEKVESSVEQYKKDLVDTLAGYEIPIDKKTVLESAEEYGKKVEEEETSIANIDLKVMSSVLKNAKPDKSKKQLKKPGKKSK